MICKIIIKKNLKLDIGPGLRRKKKEGLEVGKDLLLYLDDIACFFFIF